MRQVVRLEASRQFFVWPTCITQNCVSKTYWIILKTNECHVDSSSCLKTDASISFVDIFYLQHMYLYQHLVHGLNSTLNCVQLVEHKYRKNVNRKLKETKSKQWVSHSLPCVSKRCFSVIYDACTHARMHARYLTRAKQGHIIWRSWLSCVLCALCLCEVRPERGVGRTGQLPRTNPEPRRRSSEPLPSLHP